MAPKKQSGGTKTLRLTQEQEAHLQRIMDEMGYLSASKAIPRLFNIYDEYRTLKREHGELRNQHNKLVQYVEKVRNNFRTGFGGILQFLSLKQGNEVPDYSETEVDFLLKYPELINDMEH